jgi:ABC-2 type transport system ATP-binding protein
VTQWIWPDMIQRSETTLLDVDEMCHHYGRVAALDGVSFSLVRGVTALVGVNGAGKTTLLGAVSGAVRPMSGRISVAGHDPYGRDRRAALRAVALMPQSVTLPRRMTAQEVVAYLAWMRGAPSRRARQKAAEALERVGLGRRADSKVGELSGGMLRRVALAQALASDAEVILLDEPSTGLDPEQRRTMVDLVGALDGTVLMSSHILEDVVDVAGRVLVLDAGRLVFDGSVEELKSVAPEGTDPAKAAEVGFLHLISSRRVGRS